MNSFPSKVLRHFRITIPLLTLACLAILISPQSTYSQTFPGPAARENNRSMDQYDRDINRMKNDAKTVNERRLNRFPQINEDFQQVQVLHNEIVRMLARDKELRYDRLADLSGDMKKRSVRLRENLLLPESNEPRTQARPSETVDDVQLKKTIADLHDLIVQFVTSPVFKNLGVVDAKAIYEARDHLDDIISVSDEIKREAKQLNKAKK